MCGILGYSFHCCKSIDNTLIHIANNMLSHRGPDDSGFFCDSSCGVCVAHSRLAIHDLSSAGHQPMQSQDGTAVLVFNGEIYNFKELRAELKDKGMHFCGSSDTEVLLNLYQAEGELMLHRLNGIFAFAIWDNTKRNLFLARDALGVKPLYYAALEDRFIFASEIKALMPLIPETGILDLPSLERYMTYLWCPGDGTPLQSVRKFLPGHAMWVKRGRIERSWQWYRLPVARSNRPVCRLDEDSLVNCTTDHLRTAVHRQLVSDVPVGAFLSGGLDSSSVVALARERNPDLRCFTIDINGSGDEGFSDDLPYARRVATHLGVQLDVVQVDSARMAACFEEMVWHLDEPLADPAPLNVLFISRLAREQGIKVLLSGAGGDDLFTGYRRHLALRFERFWAWLPRRVRIQLRQLTEQVPASHPFGRRLRKAFAGAHLEGDARLVHYFRWIERSDLRVLFTPAFRAALGQVQPEDPMLAFLADLPKEAPPLQRMLALEQRFFLTDHNLIYTDKMSMAAGVEVRVPFLDLDLVDFAARIPSQYKQRGCESKWLLKKAMEPYLPHDVIYRPKSGFGAPLRSWLRVELRDWLEDTLSPDRLHSRGLFDPQAVQRLIAGNAAGRLDASYTLLSLASIEIWCKFFIDEKPLYTVRP